MDIPNDHRSFQLFYPLESCPQVTAYQFYRRNGVTYDPPGFHKFPHGGVADMSQVHFRGLFDASGRLSGIATHNSDIADGWEREGENEEFFQRFPSRLTRSPSM